MKDQPSQQREAQGDADSGSATAPIYSRSWVVTQAQIDAFADVTEDHQYIHTDPERAANSPFQGTVAHGFFLLSMLSALSYDALTPPAGMVMSVNAGFDRVRFVRPCPVGTSLRARFDLGQQTAPAPDQIAQVWNVRLENTQDPEPPLLIATWHIRLFVDPNHESATTQGEPA